MHIFISTGLLQVILVFLVFSPHSKSYGMHQVPVRALLVVVCGPSEQPDC